MCKGAHVKSTTVEDRGSAIQLACHYSLPGALLLHQLHGPAFLLFSCSGDCRHFTARASRKLPHQQTRHHLSYFLSFVVHTG